MGAGRKDSQEAGGTHQRQRIDQRHRWWATGPLRRALLAHRGVRFGLQDAPLIPEDYTFRAVASDEVLQEREFAQVAQRPALELMDQVAMQDLFYSFGRAHPGKITLHNYP